MGREDFASQEEKTSSRRRRRLRITFVSGEDFASQAEKVSPRRRRPFLFTWKKRRHPVRRGSFFYRFEDFVLRLAAFAKPFYLCVVVAMDPKEGSMISELEPDGCGVGVMNRVGPNVTVNQSDPDIVMIGTDEATKGSDPDVSTGREEGRPTSPPRHDDDPTSSLHRDTETPRSSLPCHGDDPTSVPRGDMVPRDDDNVEADDDDVETDDGDVKAVDIVDVEADDDDDEADDDDVEAKANDVEVD
ncbi:hypothetical protein AALP_AAs52786U000500 [Arabis alpina]|uniref:Uncharacterized protein n=1 Tax=Arabis alpina TaxID=50452 RepID=A0A087FZ36_ARAAL|nr:hypothetical protein AALP_AAs52786U000500 [Arabis alpina]